ncbi:Protein of unknown function [Bacillus cereus]|nr:Protein of unknown function [Bacillus cereus]
MKKEWIALKTEWIAL